MERKCEQCSALVNENNEIVHVSCLNLNCPNHLSNKEYGSTKPLN